MAAVEGFQGVHCLQVTLNSAKMHQDVGGEAEKRILAKMRELVDRPDAPERVPSGKHPPSEAHLVAPA